MSRALRDDERVKPETALRIKRAAAELGYAPNLAARNLVTGKTRTVWLMLSGIATPIEYMPAEAAGRYLLEHGYDLHAVMHHRDAEVFARLLRRLEQRLADGAIVISYGLPGEAALLQQAVERSVPLVFLDRHVPGVQAATVTSNNAAGASAVLERCHSAGASAVLNLFSRSNPVELARHEGTAAAANKLGLRLVDVATLTQLPQSTKVAILGSSSHTIHAFVRTHFQTLGQRSLVFGCFDRWEGPPYPAKEAFVCEQDFQQMAERASAHLLDVIAGARDNAAHIYSVEPAAIHHIESWDSD